MFLGYIINNIMIGCTKKRIQVAQSGQSLLGHTHGQGKVPELCEIIIIDWLKYFQVITKSIISHCNVFKSNNIIKSNSSSYVPPSVLLHLPGACDTDI